MDELARYSTVGDLWSVRWPLSTEGVVVAGTRVTGLVDKGEGRGALIYTERTGIDESSGEELFHVYHTEVDPSGWNSRTHHNCAS